MSCNDLICIFKFGFLVNFIAHNSQGVLCSKHIITLITSRPITTGLMNHNKFFRKKKLSLHPTSSKARRNHKLVCSNVSIMANRSYIAKITFRLKFFSHIKLATILLSCLFFLFIQNGAVIDLCCLESFLKLDIVLPFRVYPIGRSSYIEELCTWARQDKDKQ